MTLRRSGVGHLILLLLISIFPAYHLLISCEPTHSHLFRKWKQYVLHQTNSEMKQSQVIKSAPFLLNKKIQLLTHICHPWGGSVRLSCQHWQEETQGWNGKKPCVENWEWIWVKQLSKHYGNTAVLAGEILPLWKCETGHTDIHNVNQDWLNTKIWEKRSHFLVWGPIFPIN